MTQDSSAPQDRPEREDAPVTGDVTQGSTGSADADPETALPTVTPEQDDPDREGEDRFDAG